MNETQTPLISEGQPHGGPEYKFTREEFQVLRDCNREAFYSRSLPMAAIFGFGTYTAVKGGYLKPHPRWGSSLKVTAASFVGYFIGKFSYQTRCMERIMQLESSPLGDALRKRRGIILSEKGMSNEGYQRPVLSTSQSTYSDPDDHVSSLDVDFEKNIQFQGLDDSQRPSTDGNFSPSLEFAKDIPESTPNVSYEDLRKFNREPTPKKESIFTTNPDLRPTVQTNLPPVTSHSDFGEDKLRPRIQKKNKYGDVWEE